VYGVSALREQGRLGDARAAFDVAAPLVPASGFSDFWRDVEAELVFAEGERERGLRLVREARVMARERGHQAADRAIFAAGEGKMLVRMGMIPEAVESLSAARDWCIERGLPGFREWADVWLAAALLARGDALETPIRLLEEAIAGMERAERVLELPAAYVFLAEARWRSGDEAGHDAAAGAAYRASEGMATLAPLLAALEDAPDVLARMIDAEDADEGTWRTLARAGRPARGPTSLEGVSVLIRTLGRACIEVNGVAQDVSPPKAVEVAAAVARAGPSGISREVVADELLQGSADASTYLRQMIYRLRRALPDGVDLVSDGGRLWLTPPGAVVTEDQLFASLVARARREVGGERRRTLAKALEVADRGRLLPGVDTVSAHRLRGELDELAGETRREYADILLTAGRAVEAAVAARAAVAAEPYREDGWTLLMTAEARTSGPAAVVPLFVECARALAEIGLEPSPELRALVERLRSPVARAVTARK
jgi:DNA-binding SARP family transcriptional activator